MVPAEWDKACRLINHLEPDRFWDDTGELVPGRMGVEHKGGVVFGYLTSNPWLGRECLRVPEVSELPSDAAVPAAPSRRNATCPLHDQHVPWVTQDCTTRSSAPAVTSGECTDAADKFFADPPWYGPED